MEKGEEGVVGFRLEGQGHDVSPGFSRRCLWKFLLTDVRARRIKND